MPKKTETIKCPFCTKEAYIITYSPTRKHFKCFKKECEKSMPYEKFLYETDLDAYKELVGNKWITKEKKLKRQGKAVDPVSLYKSISNQ
tara:strand:+ start:56 stop:322 length:267 start_codon:yes stop_codon:yes gene_type:complete